MNKSNIENEFIQFTNNLCNNGKNHHPSNMQRINHKQFNNMPLLRYVSNELKITEISNIFEITDIELIKKISLIIKQTNVFKASHHSPCGTLNSKYISFLEKYNQNNNVIVNQQPKINGVEFVYCFSNPSFKDNIFKIGITKNINQRLQELYNTSTPSPFVFEFAIEAPYGKITEQSLHSYFIKHGCRISDNREYFLADKEFIYDIFCLIVKTNPNTKFINKIKG